MYGYKYKDLFASFMIGLNSLQHVRVYVISYQLT